ncbi:MAG: hypothetical protein ABI793_14890 [Flavobacterium sp.]
MRRIILFSIPLLIISCNDLKKENFKIANSISSEINPDLFSDSLFVGEPLIKQANFVRNLDEGGDNFRYIKEFEILLKKHNKKYANYKSNSFIKALKVSDKLTLELKRKKHNTKDKNTDIQIVLFTKINNVTKDSIVFYKYQINVNEPDSRSETMAFLDNDMNLWHLNSYSGQSEYFVQPESWIKYKIDSTNGRITLNEKLNYKENSDQNNNAEAVAVPVNTDNVVVDDFPFISNLSWSNNCETNNYVVFSVVGGQFRFSKQFSINTTIKKLSNVDYEVYYRHPIIRPIPENMMDCGDYSTEIPIAKMKYNDGKIEFTWMGFINSKTNKKIITQNPFTGKIEKEPIILEKCSE